MNNVKIIMLMPFLLFPMIVSAQDYSDYQQKYKEWYGVSISFPVDYASIITEQPFVFEFGLPDESKTWDTFMCGIALGNKNTRYYVYMTPLLRKPIHDSTMPTRKYEPFFSGILYNNCDIPSSKWYQYNNPTKVEKMRNECSRQYIKYLGNVKIKERTNADTICVVRIPNLAKVLCGNALTNQNLHAYYDECYGIEFYNKEGNRSVAMLTFISCFNGKTIDDYVEEISKYIKFDKEFKY